MPPVQKKTTAAAAAVEVPAGTLTVTFRGGTFNVSIPFLAGAQWQWAWTLIARSGSVDVATAESMLASVNIPDLLFGLLGPVEAGKFLGVLKEGDDIGRIFVDFTLAVAEAGGQGKAVGGSSTSRKPSSRTGTSSKRISAASTPA